MKEAAVVLGAVVGLAVAAKSKLFVAAAIAVLGFSSQAFAQSSSTSSCSDQIGDLRQVERLNHQPTPESQAQTYEGLMFSADLAQAEAQDAHGNKDECLLAVRRAEQDLQGSTNLEN
jgi:hypothetical protein